MKYVKGFDYQVCISYKKELIATMYFQKKEDAEKYYNEMLGRIVLQEDAQVSFTNYILQHDAERGYDAFL